MPSFGTIHISDNTINRQAITFLEEMLKSAWRKENRRIKPRHSQETKVHSYNNKRTQWKEKKRIRGRWDRIVVEKNAEGRNKETSGEEASFAWTHWDANKRGSWRDLRETDVSIRDWVQEKNISPARSKTFEGRTDKISSKHLQWK